MCAIKVAIIKKNIEFERLGFVVTRELIKITVNHDINDIVEMKVVNIPSPIKGEFLILKLICL